MFLSQFQAEPILSFLGTTPAGTKRTERENTLGLGALAAWHSTMLSSSTQGFMTLRDVGQQAFDAFNKSVNSLLSMLIQKRAVPSSAE